MSFDHRKPKIVPTLMITPTPAAVPVQPAVDVQPQPATVDVPLQTAQQKPPEAPEILMAKAAADFAAQNNAQAEGPAPQPEQGAAPSIGPAPDMQDDQTPAATGGSRFNLGYLGITSEELAEDSYKKLAGKRFPQCLEFTRWWLHTHPAFEYDLNYQEAIKPALAPLVLSEAAQSQIAIQALLTKSILANFSSFELKHDNTLTAYTQNNQPIKLEKDKTVRGALQSDAGYGLDYFKDMAKLYAAANAPKGETAEARGLTFALNTGELSKDTPRAAQMALASVLAAQEQGINPKIILSYKDPTIPPQTLEGETLAAYLEANKEKLLAINPEAAADIERAIAFAKNPIDAINQRLDAALKPAPAPEAAAHVSSTASTDPNAVTPENVNAALQDMMQGPAPMAAAAFQPLGLGAQSQQPSNNAMPAALGPVVDGVDYTDITHAIPAKAPDNSAVLGIPHDASAMPSVIALPDQSAPIVAEAAPAAPDVIALPDESQPKPQATSILTAGRHSARDFKPDPKTNVPVSPPVAVKEEQKPAAPKRPLAAPAVHRRP